MTTPPKSGRRNLGRAATPPEPAVLSPENVAGAQWSAVAGSVGLTARAPGGRAPHRIRPRPTPDPAAPAAGRGALSAPLEDERSTEGRASPLGACSRASESEPAARRANPAAPERTRRVREDANGASATPRMVRYRRRPPAAPSKARSSTMVAWPPPSNRSTRRSPAPTP
jgi:hypothetical protein